MAIAARIIHWNFLAARVAFQDMPAEPFGAAPDYVGDDIEIVRGNIVNFEVVSDVFSKNVGDLDYRFVTDRHCRRPFLKEHFRLLG